MKPILVAVVITALVLFSACASAPPLEPAHGWQLWQEKDCPATKRQAWQHREARVFSGVVVSGAAGASPTSPLKEAVVYARAWPRGETMEQATGADGRFSFANAAPGLYEVAVCLAGFTPWRGTVRVDSGAKAKELELGVTH